MIDAMKAPVFVIGTPRSGTTITAKILGKHSSIFMPGETHFFPDIYAKKNEIGGLDNSASRDDLLQRLSTLYGRYNEAEDQERIKNLLGKNKIKIRLSDSLGEYTTAFDTFMAIQMEHEGKKRWGNNTPKDLFYVKEILEFYPDAKFILCVRDIRDFLLSYQSKWKITADDQVDRLKKLYHPVVTTMLWKSSMRMIPIVRKMIGQENLLIQKYEDFVTDPETTVIRTCEFINETYEQSMLDVNFSNSSENMDRSRVDTKSVGKWRSNLSQEETFLAQKLASKEMLELGYELEQTRARLIRVTVILLSAPIALLIALRANQENTGSVIPYLLKRISGLLLRR